MALAGFAVLWFFGVEVAQTPAMAPNIEQGDWVLVYKPRFFVEYAYEPGDIVVVQAQDHESNLLRVIALEGDSVVQDCENLRLNALEVAQRGLVSDAIAAPDAETRVYVETLPGGASYRIQRDALELCSMQSLGIELPPGSVYALGDNRSGAYDSRQRGPYARHELRGKAWLGLRTASPNGGLLGRWFKPL